MKKLYLFLSLLFIVTLACNLAVNMTSPTSPAAVSTNTPAIVEMPTQNPVSPTVPVPNTLSPETPEPVYEGVEVSVAPLTVVLPSGLASGGTGSQFPRAEGESVAPWDITPSHTVLKLEGYPLQGKFHEPKIYVFPASGYAEMDSAAFESMHRLNNIFANPGAPISADQLPTVPFFNAAQVFASNIQAISFQNGKGVRFLTEYAQYAASANNTDLFYHFQGLTGDGAYYVIAILPVTAPLLPGTSDAGAAVPAGGIPLPDMANPNADWQGYYAAVTNLLNTTSPDAFTPTLGQLDQLIQSIRINP